MSAPSCGIGRPCGLLPRWSRGISTHANAVNAADTRMSGARRLWKACSYRNDPTLSAKEGARLVTDIRTAKAKPSDRLGLVDHSPPAARHTRCSISPCHTLSAAERTIIDWVRKLMLFFGVVYVVEGIGQLDGITQPHPILLEGGLRMDTPPSHGLFHCIQFSVDH